MSNQSKNIRGGKVVTTIDMTPKWEDIMLVYAESAAKGNHDAMDELRRAGRLADKYIALSKVLNAEMDNLPPKIKKKVLEAMGY